MSQDISTERLDELVEEFKPLFIVPNANKEPMDNVSPDLVSALLELKRRREQDALIESCKMPRPMLDGNGNPIRGGFMRFFAHDTSEPKTTYADAELSTAHTWPIVLDSNGVAPTIFLEGKDPANEYDLQIEDWKGRPIIKFSPLHPPVVPRWLAWLCGI